MKLIIDIPDYDLDNVQVGSIASKIIFKAVKNGIPLDDIKAEMKTKMDLYQTWQRSDYQRYAEAFRECLEIIDEHLNKVKQDF